jgi:hypothetical protein
VSPIACECGAADTVRRRIALEDNPLAAALDVLPIFSMRPFGVIKQEDEVVPFTSIRRLETRA